MRVMATITGNFRLGTRKIHGIYFANWGIRFRRREQGMMSSLRLFHRISVVTSTAEIGGGAGRGVCRGPRPEVGTTGTVCCVAQAARAGGTMDAQRFTQRRRKLSGVVGAVQGIGHFVVAENTEL